MPEVTETSKRSGVNAPPTRMRLTIAICLIRASGGRLGVAESGEIRPNVMDFVD